jgi:hypothetical protein
MKRREGRQIVHGNGGRIVAVGVEHFWGDMDIPQIHTQIHGHRPKNSVHTISTYNVQNPLNSFCAKYCKLSAYNHLLQRRDVFQERNREFVLKRNI